MPKTHEFRVRSITRYILNEYIDDGVGRGVKPVAVFDSYEIANDVAIALAQTYNGTASLWVKSKKEAT